MAPSETAITMPISRCLGVRTVLHLEEKLLREAERELIAKESGALSWKQLVEDWEVDIRGGSSFGHSPISPKTQGATDTLSLLPKSEGTGTILELSK